MGSCKFHHTFSVVQKSEIPPRVALDKNYYSFSQIMAKSAIFRAFELQQPRIFIALAMVVMSFHEIMRCFTFPCDVGLYQVITLKQKYF